jgi:hypothetical protein
VLRIASSPFGLLAMTEFILLYSLREASGKWEVENRIVESEKKEEAGNPGLLFLFSGGKV